MDKEKKFWVRYLFFLTIVFAIIFSGLTWDLNKLGFDPMTGVGLPQTTTIYYYKDSAGFHIDFQGYIASLNTSLLPNAVEGQCYVLSVNVDIIGRHVTIENEKADGYFCGLSHNLPYGLPP